MNKQNMSEHMHQRTGDYIFLQQETSQLWTELIDYGCVIVYCVSVRSHGCHLHLWCDATSTFQTSQLRAVLHSRKQEKRIMMMLFYGFVSVL